VKKTIVLIALLILAAGFSQAGSVFFKLQGMYFSPTDDDFKEIYGGGIMYGAEFAITIWENLDFCLGGSYFTKSGELTFTKEETSLTIVPIFGGLRYRITYGTLNIYAGFGVDYFLFKESNEPIGDVSEGGIGLEAKLGAFLKLSKGFLLDFHVNFSYCKIQPADFIINIGGLEGGIGLGYEF